jgi:hypothetical protein
VSWSPVEERGGVDVSSITTGAGDDEVVVVMIRAARYGSIPEVLENYALDLATRLKEGWSLLAMSTYSAGHTPGAGWPGMDLDKAMVVATYRRTGTSVEQK